VHLTEQGRELVIKSKNEFESSIDVLFSDLSAEELSTLIKIMKKTQDSIKGK